jgi:hypothetical protein
MKPPHALRAPPRCVVLLLIEALDLVKMPKIMKMGKTST